MQGGVPATGYSEGVAYWAIPYIWMDKIYRSVTQPRVIPIPHFPPCPAQGKSYADSFPPFQRRNLWDVSMLYTVYDLMRTLPLRFNARGTRRETYIYIFRDARTIYKYNKRSTWDLNPCPRRRQTLPAEVLLIYIWVNGRSITRAIIGWNLSHHVHVRIYYSRDACVRSWRHPSTFSSCLSPLRYVLVKG